MTKEELKHEAEEKAKKRTKEFKCQENCEMSYVIGALDFAEPREKRIEELEKENADLVKNYQVSRLYLEGYDDAKKEAKKEISELKEQNIKDCENFNKKMKEIKEQWNKEHYQLIKAKDLIAKLYHADECFTYDEEVEQFLKESEQWKNQF
jgi:hypothetical protein